MSQNADDPELERRLLDRVRGGDRTAFGEVVLLHRLAIYRVARRLVGSHEDADDVAQETFVRAWRALPEFRGDSRLSTWLVRIAINVARTSRRDRGREAAMERPEALVDPGERADVAADRRSAGERVRRAVASLPPRQREVVVLKVFSELTHDDVARAMGLTVGAVKAHLHQAIANLRRRMADGGAS